MKKQTETEVLVVGAGPSGLIAAIILAEKGVRVTIIDKKESVAEQSRAAIIHVRTLELLDKVGLAQPIIDQGLQINRVEVYAGGRQATEFPLVTPEMSQTTPFPFAISLEQYKTEKLLIKHLQSRGVKVGWKTEFLSYDGQTGKAKLRLADDTTQELTASWIIGADGASSTIRQTLGLGFEGKTYAITGFLADVEIEHPQKQGGPGTASSSLRLNLVKGGFVGMLPLSNGQYRLFGAVPEEMAAKNSQKQVSHEAYAVS